MILPSSSTPQNPLPPPQNPLPPLEIRQAHFNNEVEMNKKLREIIPQLIIVYALLYAKEQGIPPDEQVCQKESLRVSAEIAKLFPEIKPIIGDQMPPPPVEVKNHADITRQNLAMIQKIEQHSYQESKNLCYQIRKQILNFTEKKRLEQALFLCSFLLLHMNAAAPYRIKPCIFSSGSPVF